jgi:hypothetical protein
MRDVAESNTIVKRTARNEQPNDITHRMGIKLIFSRQNKDRSKDEADGTYYQHATYLRHFK